MKRSLVILVLSCLMATAAVYTNVTLVFDYPTNELSTNLTFKLYSTTNITLPLTNWTAATNILGTLTNFIVPIGAGWSFYYATASNEFGESLPSNLVTGLVARSGGIRIRPGP